MRLRSTVGVIAVVLTSLSPARGETHSCLATWYGPGFEGKRMANGHAFHGGDPTIAAHRTLPLGTKVRLENLGNGREITATIQDRGPVARRLSFDLSKAAAEKLGFIRSGTACLKVTRVPAPQYVQ